MKKAAFIFISTLLYLLTSQGPVFGNNIQVSNVSVASQDTINGFSLIEFDLQWENSWRLNPLAGSPSNWDAAWVFIKVISAPFEASGADNVGTVITCSSTERLRVGMRMDVIGGIGAFDDRTVVDSIYPDGITFSVNRTPSTNLVGATIRGGDLWETAYLHNSGHTIPAGATSSPGLLDISAAFNDTANPVLGMFIYRSAAGGGTFDVDNIQLRWNYRAMGYANDDEFDIQVHAIEMVYIPEGPYNFAGGGAATSRVGAPAGGFSAPSEVTIDTAATNFTSTAPGAYGGTSGGLPIEYSLTNADYPNAYNAYYLMKYEISQQHYADFLNTLFRYQQNARTTTAFSSTTSTITNRYVMTNSSAPVLRNAIAVDQVVSANTSPLFFYCDLNNDGVPGGADDGDWLACNYLDRFDFLAYLDWAGLRPMTEFEFEKSCRGIANFPLGGELANGVTTFIAVKDSGIANPGQIDERPVAIGTANMHLNEISSANWYPIRVGCLANSSSTRVSSGAGFYGNMNMSDNLYELSTSITNGSPGDFTRFLHGDGYIDPVSSESEELANLITGVRGGTMLSGTSSFNPITTAYISSRFRIYDLFGRQSYVGGRGARSVN